MDTDSEQWERDQLILGGSVDISQIDFNGHMNNVEYMHIVEKALDQVIAKTVVERNSEVLFFIRETKMRFLSELLFESDWNIYLRNIKYKEYSFVLDFVLKSEGSVKFRCTTEIVPINKKTRKTHSKISDLSFSIDYLPSSFLPSRDNLK
jgi:acyl-CoA thioesterase FadM